MTNKDRSQKDDNRDVKKSSRDTGKNVSGASSAGPSPRSTDLRDSPMMAHLLDALERGKDIGHYGRLTFVMVARHFLSEKELVKLLAKGQGMDEDEAQLMVRDVQERGYNPPSRERILEWMEMQDFPICPDAKDPTGCNVYRELQFPDEIYDQIEEFREERFEANDQ